MADSHSSIKASGIEMAPPDIGIYVAHGLFWSSFGLTLFVLRFRRADAAPKQPAVEKQQTAPYSRALVAVHALGFAVMYFGVAQAVFSGQVPNWFPGQRVAGGLVIGTGAVLMVWALIYFRSWRFRAQLDEGHQLATGGPFGLMRHPIYMGLNLLALGTALWVPTVLVWVGFVLMVVGGDLRGRAEEKLLAGAFGDSYSSYAARTRRFVPGIY
jgi:protein-S-isoprenylcysteine O-methyltransferase Ste14